MIYNTKYYLIFALITFSLISCNNEKEVKKNTNLQTKSKEVLLTSWQEGYLDIHHINTGRGNATFMILPDGTTMLFDAGNLDKKSFEKRVAPLKVSSPKPNNTLSAAQWIALYIKKTIPKNRKLGIDYAVISHFHEDHYGSLAGLGKEIPIHKIIDRGAPNYNFPFDLKNYLRKDSVFQNYLSFIHTTKATVETLQVGSKSQIRLLNTPKKYPSFKIRNVKSNGTIWTGKAEKTFTYFTAKEVVAYYKGKYNENPLSLALKISYGDFDYFTGGDNTGLQGFGLPNWFDVETPIAKAVGKV
ncbi:MAG: MBL fold metallo-hydrolase, partial [Polaribacter sp.]